MFAAVMLLVMAVTAWVGGGVDRDGFVVNVLAGLFSIALGLLAGYLLVDRFADYVAERQWRRTRLYTLQAIAAHLCDIGLYTHIYFGVSSGFSVLGGRNSPNPETPSDFAKLVAQLEALPSSMGKEKSASDVAAVFYDGATWDLDQVQMVLTPRVVQSSRNQVLIDTLVEFDAARRSLHNGIIAHKLVVTQSVMRDVVRLMEVSGRLYGVVADEWRKCLGDRGDRGVGPGDRSREPAEGVAP